MNETGSFEDSSFQQNLPQWVWEYFFPFIKIYRYTVDNFMLASSALSNLLVLYLILGALIYIFVVKYTLKSNRDEVNKRILLVIAHPDDECMFFGPTILGLINTSEVYLLCLSIGDHYKRGSARKEELYKSCRVFSISQSNILIMNNSRMPDNPDIIWNAKRTGRILLEHIESLSIEEVYTFDVGGVSGHLNHVSIFYGFAELCLSGDLPSGVKVFLLDSVNKLRKYSLFCDAALSVLLLNKRLFIVTWSEANIIREAMHKHQSQLIWYRAFYIYLSRYMYMNTYKELELENIQMVLPMSHYIPL